MTSQVALLNPHGVALASDSAVTLGAKTYNTVNKIFPLIYENGNGKTKHHVAFMVSNSGTYIPGGMLWERVFHAFSKTQPTIHPTLKKYVEELINFLGKKEMFDDQQNDLGVQRELMHWFENHPAITGHRKIQSALETIRWGWTRDDPDEELDSEMRETLALQINDRIDQMHNKFMNDKDDALARSHDEFAPKEIRIRKRNNHNSQAAAELLVRRYELEPRFVDVLTDIFNVQLTFYPEPEGRAHTKIVAVGFGHEDRTPLMCEILCGAQIDPGADLITVKEWFSIRQSQSLEDNGRLFDEEIDGVVYNDGGAIIRGLAYHNEMDNLLNGLHLQDMNHLRRWGRGGVSQHMTDTIMHQIYRSLGQFYSSNSTKPDELMKVIRNHKWKMSRASGEPLDVDIRDYIHQEMWDEAIVEHGMIKRRQKFRDAAEFFPIPDLADFAHSLVRMEAEICHWMEPVRSVGGPIDVLTITKEDGCLLETRS